MAVVGPGQESDEFHATLCIKDSGGPYHEGLNKKMRVGDRDQADRFATDSGVDHGSAGPLQVRRPLAEPVQPDLVVTHQLAVADQDRTPIDRCPQPVAWDRLEPGRLGQRQAPLSCLIDHRLGQRVLARLLGRGDQSQ